MKTIIFIAGPKNHGKNYLCNLFMNKKFSEIKNGYDIIINNSNSLNLFEKVFKPNNKYYEFAFADELKKEYRYKHNIQYDEYEKNKEIFRKLIQNYSKEKLLKDENYYTKIVYEKIKNIKNIESNFIFITDYRKPSELDFFLHNLKNSYDVNFQTWYVFDSEKSQDSNDEWENCLHKHDFHIIFNLKK